MLTHPLLGRKRNRIAAQTVVDANHTVGLACDAKLHRREIEPTETSGGLQEGLRVEFCGHWQSGLLRIETQPEGDEKVEGC